MKCSVVRACVAVNGCVVRQAHSDKYAPSTDDDGPGLSLCIG